MMEKTLQNVIKEVFVVLELKKESQVTSSYWTSLLDHSMTKYLKAEQLQLWQQY